MVKQSIKSRWSPLFTNTSCTPPTEMQYWFSTDVKVYITIFMFTDRASLYNLVNKANLVHNLLSVYLSISTCFGQLCAHHQEIQLCLYDTWYLLFCVNDCLVCRSICSCIPDSHPHRITSTKCRINTVVSPDDGHIVAQNM